MSQKLFIFFIFVILTLCKVESSWLTSCKACVAELEECSVCIKTSCDYCFQIDHSECSKCWSDIKIVNQNQFICDSTIDFHKLACHVYCRYQDVIPFFTIGNCDQLTQKCLCS
ncbi:unnamed protein product [Brachionus calyciflorus]|uniref:Twisted gastrulation n=1 Tax=Brachionus calyciflorus TaxID=104777 RepID=A0A813PWQ5_9BILA|nr:unnamed protein product [Brachionus calyciflorus]